jgi:glycine/D-amino acid oxidase-like deaminating enzyme
VPIQIEEADGGTPGTAAPVLFPTADLASPLRNAVVRSGTVVSTIDVVFNDVNAVGLRPATADEMPIIGRSAKMPGLVYATGHYRNGVLLAPLTARAVADLVLDNREDPLLAPAAPQRFGEC